MKANLLYRRNPLAYPAGCAPGFDPTHPALATNTFSAVPSGGGFIDVVTGKRGASTTPTFAINSIGPSAVVGTTAATGYTFAGQAALAANQSVTAAAIFMRVGAPTNAFGTLISTDSAGAGGIELGILTTNVHLMVNINGGAQFDSGLLLSVGVPYFGAVTLTSSTMSFVLTRLDTGAVQTATIAGAAIGAVATPTFAVGIVAGGQVANSNIAAAMLTWKYVGMAALLAWAADPWSFWYPRQSEILVSAAIQYAAFCTPQHDGAVYTKMTGY